MGLDRSRSLDVGVLRPADVARYAAASGDRNPIHLDAAYARASGYPTVLVHGMLAAGLLSSFLAGWLPDGFVKEFSVRFHKPVLPDANITISGNIENQETRLSGIDYKMTLSLEVNEQICSSANAIIFVQPAERVAL